MRTVIALAGIAALCAVAIFVALAIVVVRQDLQSDQPGTGMAVDVAGQIVIIYPDPDMVVRIASDQSGGTPPDGTGGFPEGAQPTTPPDGSQPSIATLPLPVPTATFPPPTPWPPSVILVGYVVVPGDTLYGLTQKHNTSIDLMARYGIDANDMIVGNQLSLPVANPAYCPGSRPHVVRDQQTVMEIAQAYNTTPQAIAALNGLDASYSVKTSQVICVPY